MYILKGGNSGAFSSKYLIFFIFSLGLSTVCTAFAVEAGKIVSKHTGFLAKGTRRLKQEKCGC